MSNVNETESRQRNGTLSSTIQSPFGRPQIGLIKGNEEDYEREIVALYLREVGSIPLLSPGEEIAMARQIQAGNLARRQIEERIESKQEIDPLEQEDLAITVQEGEAARAQLIRTGERYVVGVANGYRNQDVRFLDLTQEGYYGLVAAVDKFDPQSGQPFSTRAIYFIRQSIARALATGLNGDTINRVAHAGVRLQQELGRSVFPDEIAAALGMSIHEVVQVLAATHGKTLDVLGDNPPEANPEELVIAKTLRHDIEESLATLSARHQRVLEHHYGLCGRQPISLKEIAKLFDDTEYTIEQLHQEALVMLRNPQRSALLRDYRY